ncbi:MAG: hypothetical protein IJJ26_11660 [Victivallales bacterium]|nr:hypothetical protein [Victivallales bacterium]
MKFLLDYIRYVLAWRKWRRKAHEKRGPGLKIGNLPELFRHLDEVGVRYVVLRWPEELPRSLEAEKTYVGDVDFLLDSDDLQKFCRAVTRFPGQVKTDIYTENGKMGTGFGGRLSYLMPWMAEGVLERRQLWDNFCYVPSPEDALMTLVYHFTYQKGLLSGLDTGLDGVHNELENRHSPEKAMRKLASAVGETLPEQMTLWSLHGWLVEHGWSMPYDLLCRWSPAKRNGWHDQLQKRLEKDLRESLHGCTNLLVFFLRAEAVKAGLEDEMTQELASRFRILERVELSAEARERVCRHTRGGNWGTARFHQLEEPVVALVCKDEHPQTMEGVDPKLAAKHRVENANVFFKQQLREQLLQRHPDVHSNFLHGSDNDLESAEYLAALYGPDFQDAIQRLHEMMK